MLENYEQLRLGLERLAEEFDETSRRLPAVYHQIIKSWEQLSDEAWAAFIDGNRRSAGDDSWEVWRVHPDNVSCSRFWGKGSQVGLDEFLRLANSGFEILDDLRHLQSEAMVPEEAKIRLHIFEGPKAWGESTGYFEWLEVIHDTALGCHTSRLHLHVGNWGYNMPEVPAAEGCEIVEGLEDEWSDGDSNKSYPLHPLVDSLRENVMVSSAEAIRIWLAVFDDELVPIDIGIEDSPIYLPGLDDVAIEDDVAENVVPQTGGDGEEGHAPPTVVAPGPPKLVIDPETFSVSYGQIKRQWNNTCPFHLLGQLNKRPGQPVSISALRDHVWKDAHATDETIQKQVSNLRSKLEEDGFTGIEIDGLSVWGHFILILTEPIQALQGGHPKAKKKAAAKKRPAKKAAKAARKAAKKAPAKAVKKAKVKRAVKKKAPPKVQPEAVVPPSVSS